MLHDRSRVVEKSWCVITYHLCITTATPLHWIRWALLFIVNIGCFAESRVNQIRCDLSETARFSHLTYLEMQMNSIIMEHNSAPRFTFNLQSWNTQPFSSPLPAHQPLHSADPPSQVPSTPTRFHHQTHDLLPSPSCVTRGLFFSHYLLLPIPRRFTLHPQVMQHLSLSSLPFPPSSHLIFSPVK